jgi:5-methylcytosine-specific restriction endonuclease McrA
VPLTICPEPHCGQITTGGRCPTHAAPLKAADSKRRVEQRRRAGRNTRAWQATRQRVLARDHHTCIHCGGPGNQVHRRDQGFHTTGIQHDDEYVVLCAKCHGRYHAAMRRARPRPR